ncbi:MAG: hypothetical protein J1F18_02870 [Lachnospiraceae bacterium]|nr:hypothetical protein [Lachnospiraceae bacterium]
MDAITGGNIQIDSDLRIKYITTLRIVTEMQKHGTCRLTGVIEDGLGAQQILSSRDDIPISIIRNGDCIEVLFRGIIKKAEIDVVNGISYVHILAMSLSEMLDRTKKQRSFQDVTMTYEQAVARVLETYGNLTAFYSKNAQETLNEPVIQYGETDWEFLLRLGSHLHIPVYADGVSRSKVLCFGVEEGVHVNIEGNDYHAGISEKYHEADERRDSVTRKDYLYYRITCDENYRIGDEINAGVYRFIIFKKSAELVHEKLEFTYWAGGCGNLYIPYIEHNRLIGMEFTGTVVGTQAEKAKIRLKIDEPYEGADYEWDWVPPSGNIMYAMPERETSVRLIFGSETPSEGIATSNARESSGSIPEWQNRTFMTGAGKKAEFYPKRLVFQGGNGQIALSDGKAVAITNMTKLEITARGAIRLAATSIYGQVPLEINMYRARVYCEEKGKNITARGTKSNPPTGVGDSGFTINNEFNASAQRSVVCSNRFICYKPFQDDPEETNNIYEDTFKYAGIASGVLAGTVVVGVVTVAAVYVAAAAVEAGIAIACAPYVVGVLTPACGEAAVLGQANKDIKNDTVSGLGTYLESGLKTSLMAAVAAMAVCMAPAVAARDTAKIVAAKSTVSATEAVAVNSTRILRIAMVKRVGGNALSIAFLVNNAVADLRGENTIRDAVGEEVYDSVQNSMYFYSVETFFIGFSMMRAFSINMVEGDTDARSSRLVFGSNTKSAQKLSNQMSSRGWTEELIRDTVDNPFTTRGSINKATGNAATVFYTEQGSYVIVDNVTNEIVQISDNINPLDWIPDSSIENPYKP